MEEEYYISCTKEQFIESITCSVNNYKHPWFSLDIKFFNDSFIITPSITIMYGNPFRAEFKGKIFEETSGVKIIGAYKMMFLIKVTLIIFVLGLFIEILSGNFLQEMIITPFFFVFVIALYTIPKRACQRFLREYFSTLTNDTLKKKDKI